MRVPINPAMALFMALAIPVTSQAVEWSAEPSISLRTGYDDNIRLTTADHDAVWESTLSPSVRFGAVKENQGLTGDAGFAIRRYTGGTGQESSDALDREDYHFNSTAFHNTLRDSFEANLGYTQDSTLDSELDQTGNVITERATREQFSLGPSWSRSFTELTRTDLSYQYSNVDYTDGPGIQNQNLVGYTSHVASASLVRQLTPRIQGTLSGGYSIYQPDTDFDSDTLSLQAGLSTNFSETLVASFLVGQRETTSDSFTATGFCIGAAPGASFPSCSGGIPIPTGTADTEIETTSAVYTASIIKQLETGSLSATLSRSTFPSSEGELLDSTRLSLNGSHRLTETLNSSLLIEYTENETIVNRVGFVPNQDNDTFFRVTPKVAWHWRREWELAGDYQYARSEGANQNEASRNALYLTLSYLPGKRYVSR